MTERRGVLVNDNVVVNVVVWGDSSAEQFSNEGYQHAEETTDFETPPGIGWTWSASDGYRSPQPYPSWTYNGSTWLPPVPVPSDGGPYSWNETTTSWEALV